MDEKFYCDECDFDTINKIYLRTHKRVKHTDEGICYRCDICSQSFAFPWGVDIHKRELHGTELLNCKICGHLTNSIYNLKRHESRHHDKNNTVTFIDCSTCGEKVKNTDKERRSHRYKHFPRNKRKDPSTHTLSCNQCDYITDKDRYLRMHMVNYHSSNQHICDLCPFQTPFETKLKIHKHTAHILQSCDDCGFKTNIKDTMSKHKLSHKERKGPGWKPTECRFCGYPVPTTDILLSHRKEKHASEYVFCDQCDYSATRVRRLKMHRKKLHYQCDVCNTNLNSKDLLDVHERDIHGKSHKCTHCSSTFTNIENFKSHMVRIHQISVIRCLKRGCDYFAPNKELLQNHKDEKHKEQDKKMQEIYNARRITKDKLQNRKDGERERTKGEFRCRDGIKNDKRFKKIADCNFVCIGRAKFICHRADVHPTSRSREKRKRAKVKSVHKWSTLSKEGLAEQEYFEEETNKVVGHDIIKLKQLPKQEYFEEDVKMQMEVKARVAMTTSASNETEVDNATIDKSNVEYEDEVVAEICAESTSDHGINDCANTVNPEQPETNARPDDDDISEEEEEVGCNTREYLEEDNKNNDVISDDEEDHDITIINSANSKGSADTRVTSKTTDNGATYVCPLDSCLFMTQSAEDSLQTDHFSLCHPHTDITGVKFIAL